MRIMKIKMRNTMRKLMVLWMVACICQLGYGQRNVDQLFKAFRGESDVTSVRIGSFAMRLASLFTDTYGVRGVDVLALDDCDGAVKERFSAAVRDLWDADYETMLTSNEDGERARGERAAVESALLAMAKHVEEIALILRSQSKDER